MLKIGMTKKNGKNTKKGIKIKRKKMKRKAVRGDFQVLKSVQLRKTVEQSLDSTFVETEKIAFDGNR